MYKVEFMSITVYSIRFMDIVAVIIILPLTIYFALQHSVKKSNLGLDFSTTLRTTDEFSASTFEK